MYYVTMNHLALKYFVVVIHPHLSIMLIDNLLLVLLLPLPLLLPLLYDVFYNVLYHNFVLLFIYSGEFIIYYNISYWSWYHYNKEIYLLGLFKKEDSVVGIERFDICVCEIIWFCNDITVFCTLPVFLCWLVLSRDTCFLELKSPLEDNRNRSFDMMFVKQIMNNQVLSVFDVNFIFFDRSINDSKFNNHNQIYIYIYHSKIYHVKHIIIFIT